MKAKKQFFCLWVLLLIMAQAVPLYAVGSGGFENPTLSARGVGRAGAYVADAEDPSAVSYNPAGMTKLKGVQVEGGFAGINLITKFRADGDGTNARTASKLALVPNTYATVEVPKLPVYFGFGMNAPFGLKNQYSSTNPFRYIGYKNEMSVLAYTMSGAVKICPLLSVGAGATYYDANLGQLAKFNSDLITQSTFPGLPYAGDANVRVKAGGNGWGWNLGAMFTPGEKHSIGFNYRSIARLGFKGRIDVEDIEGLVMQGIFGGPHFTTPITTDVKLPPQATIGYKYQATKTWDVELDLAMTQWSVFDRQAYTFGTPNAVLLGMTPIPQGFHDTFSMNLGTDWDVTKWLTLRGGYFFYQSPARKGNTGSAIPNANWNGISVGFGLNWKSITLDAAYAVEFAPTVHVKNTSIGDSAGVVAEGKYDNYIGTFMFGLTYRFGG